jgi:phosphoribosyl 1,2-cyclic phosphodiesterase
MKVKYWGVRGSIPSSPPPEQMANAVERILIDFFQTGHSQASQVKEYIQKNHVTKLGGFGTATTCAAVESDNGAQIIIDGGSGIRMLGEDLMKGLSAKGKGNIHIFLTHFHWDHMIGLPFFVPMFVAGNRINFYAVQDDLEELVKGVFRRPYFPVAFEALPSSVHFHQLQPRKPIQIDDFSVTPYQLDHPDPCWGYRVECGKKSYAHCVDTEGTRITPEQLGPDLPLYQKADLMYFDAQYTLPELAEKSNWGHSAAQIGLDIAFRESIKKVIFAHHDPRSFNDHVEQLKSETTDYYRWRMKQAETNRQKLPEVEWLYAYEGLIAEIK